LTHYEGPVGAIFLAISACIASSDLMNGPCWWLAWTFGIGGALLFIGAGIRGFLGDADG
jgi:hypothetical protein